MNLLKHAAPDWKAAPPTRERAASPLHAVVWIDHHSARVLQFDPEQIKIQKIQAHTHAPLQHGGSERTEDQFFGEVCDELAGIGAVVVTGSDSPLSDFRHYIDGHRDPVAVHR